MGSRAALLLILLFYRDVRGSEYSSSERSLHIDTLLAEYDREAAPSAPVLLTLGLDVRHASVDDKASSMRLLADLHMSWTDTRLSWNTTQWDGDSILVNGDRLWTPDVQLVSAGAARSGGGAVRARVSAGGAVTRVTRLDLAVPLALELTRWPEDTQRANFTFASRAHNEDEIDLVVDEYKGSVVIESGVWEVQSVIGTKTSRSGGAAAAVWCVAATRRSAALAAQHGALLAAVTLLLAAALARPYTQRMPLAACATLLAALWLISVVWVVPAGASVPRVVRALCGACALGAVVGAAAALAAAVSRRTAPPPHSLRALLSKLSAIHTITPDPQECGSERCSGAWAAAARLLDAVLAALAALALLVLLAVYNL